MQVNLNKHPVTHFRCSAASCPGNRVHENSAIRLHSRPDRCKINLVRCRVAHARQIKLMEQICFLIKMKSVSAVTLLSANYVQMIYHLFRPGQRRLHLFDRPAGPFGGGG